MQNADFISNFFYINRGLRHGCPLSPYLFILCIEILAAALLNDHEITGIKINGERLKILFADDATFAMDQSLKCYDFTIMSGLNLNGNKLLF